MAVNPILIRIRSLFEKKGTEEASKNVEQLGKKSQDAAKGASELERQTESVGAAAGETAEKVEDAASQVDDFQKRLNDASTAAENATDPISKAADQVDKAGKKSATTTGQLGAVARAMQTLGIGSGGAAGQVAGLVGTITQLGPGGAAMAAAAAWINVVRLVVNAQDEMGRSLREIREGNFDAGADSLARAYSKLNEETEKVVRSIKNELDARRDMMDAEKQRALASLELEKQGALASEADPEKRRLAEASFARRAAAIEAGSASNSADTEIESIQMERIAVESKLANATEEMFARLAKAADASDMVDDTRKAMDRDSRRGIGSMAQLKNVFTFSSGARAERGAATHSEEMARWADRGKDAVGEAEELRRLAEGLRSELDRLDAAEAAAKVRREATLLKSGADAVRTLADERQAQASIHAAERDRALRSEEDRIRGMREPTQSRVSREQADVATARERLSKAKGGYGEESARKNLEKQIRELEEARAADARVFAQVTRMLEQLNRQKQAQEAQIKRM